MTRLRVGALLLALSIAMASPTDARAESTVWSRAANPSTFARGVLLGKVDALINEYVHLLDTPTAFRRSQVLGRARRKLELADAANSDNASLRLRLAKVYYLLYDVEGDETRLDQAIAHYQWALKNASLPTLTKARILNSLAIALARLARHEEEVARYDDAIAIDPDPAAQAVLRANQAEGFMARGQILEAIRGYRSALAATPTAIVNQGGGVTTIWGLAVALDRSGDVRGALEHVARARSYDPFDRLLQSSSWFFVPTYDEDWYLALGHWQRARSTDLSDEERLDAYDSAIASWRSYMNRAPMEDHWLPLAAVRLRTCEQERQQARERFARSRREQAGRPAPRKDLRWLD